MVGFAMVQSLTLLATVLCICSCWLYDFPRGYGVRWLYLTLFFFNALQSLNYTTEFAYISLTYPPALYGELVAITIFVQGVVGLLAWPIGLSSLFGQ